MRWNFENYFTHRILWKALPSALCIDGMVFVLCRESCLLIAAFDGDPRVRGERACLLFALPGWRNTRVRCYSTQVSCRCTAALARLDTYDVTRFNEGRIG